MIRECNGDWKRKDDYKDNNSLYVPLGNQDVEFGSLIMKALLINLVKVLEIQESFLKEIKADILHLSEKVELHVITIKAS